MKIYDYKDETKDVKGKVNQNVLLILIFYRLKDSMPSRNFNKCCRTRKTSPH